MIKTVKKALPVSVFIMLGTATVLLQLSPSRQAILLVGAATASSIALLLYAVIRWDDVHADQELERRQLADVVGRSMDAIVIADPRGRVLYANSAAEAAYAPRPAPAAPAGSALVARTSREPGGGSRAELLGGSLTVLGFDDQQLKDVVGGVLAGSPWKGELNHVGRDGTEGVSFVNLFRLEAFQGEAPVVAAIAHDLTERRVLQARLLHSQKLAAVGELAAGLAHEINNPMAAIQSQVGLARDLLCMPAPSAGHREELLACIDESDRQVKRCSHIVGSLLRFSRRQQQEVGEIDLQEAVEQALTFVGTLPRMKHIELRHAPGGTTVRALANLESVTQILVNLLINAADATARRGRVTIGSRAVDADRVAIEVRDNGSGIAPEVLERVFEPFFTTKPAPQGTGLGLSISYGLAQSQGGDLALESLAGGGTLATLTLRAAPAAELQLAGSAG